MRPDPVRPVLRIVDAAETSSPPARSPLLARFLDAAEPGDVDAILIGLIIGVLLVAGLVVADNASLITNWLLG